MEGTRTEDELVGINPRALRRLFELIAEKKALAAIGGASADGWSYEVQVRRPPSLPPYARCPLPLPLPLPRPLPLSEALRQE